MTGIRKKVRHLPFTLVELIVSMAVFALLATVVVQLFAASQKLWSSTTGKNELYRDARMTLDLMSDLLTNVVFVPTSEEGTRFFRIYNNDVIDKDDNNKSYNNFSRICFATSSNNDALTQHDIYRNSLRFVSFQVVKITASTDPDKNRNCLVMQVLSDEDEKKFIKYFPPYDAATEGLAGDDLAALLGDTTKAKTKPAAQDENVIRLLNNVVAFRVRRVQGNTPNASAEAIYKQTNTTEYSGTMDSGTGLHQSVLPDYLEITLEVMETQKYDEYMALYEGSFGSADAQKFRAQHAQIFRRYIYFGENRTNAF